MQWVCVWNVLDGFSVLNSVFKIKNVKRCPKSCDEHSIVVIYNIFFPPLCSPKEFIECVSHIRQLSWLLLGSLTHCALHQGSTSCMPIPLDAGSHIADHLIVILIGFPEQSKVWQKLTPLTWVNPGFVNPMFNHLTGPFLLFWSPSPDIGAAHVLSVPCLYVCPAVDHLLWAGGRRAIAAEPQSNWVFLRCHPHWAGVLESGYTQHPSAHGPQQGGECFVGLPGI